MDITASYQLGSAGDRVGLHGELEMRPKGMLKLILPLIRRSLQKDLDRQYQSFRQFCESSAPTARD